MDKIACQPVVFEEDVEVIGIRPLVRVDLDTYSRLQSLAIQQGFAKPHVTNLLQKFVSDNIAGILGGSGRVSRSTDDANGNANPGTKPKKTRGLKATSESKPMKAKGRGRSAAKKPAKAKSVTKAHSSPTPKPQSSGLPRQPGPGRKRRPPLGPPPVSVGS